MLVFLGLTVVAPLRWWWWASKEVPKKKKKCHERSLELEIIPVACMRMCAQLVHAGGARKCWCKCWRAQVLVHASGGASSVLGILSVQYVMALVLLG